MGERGWRVINWPVVIVKILFIWMIPLKALYHWDYSREFDNAGWSFWACLKDTWVRWWL